MMRKYYKYKGARESFVSDRAEPTRRDLALERELEG